MPSLWRTKIGIILTEQELKTIVRTSTAELHKQLKTNACARSSAHLNYQLRLKFWHQGWQLWAKEKSHSWSVARWQSSHCTDPIVAGFTPVWRETGPPGHQFPRSTCHKPQHPWSTSVALDTGVHCLTVCLSQTSNYVRKTAIIWPVMLWLMHKRTIELSQCQRLSRPAAI